MHLLLGPPSLLWRPGNAEKMPGGSIEGLPAALLNARRKGKNKGQLLGKEIAGRLIAHSPRNRIKPSLSKLVVRLKPVIVVKG